MKRTGCDYNIKPIYGIKRIQGVNQGFSEGFGTI